MIWLSLFAGNKSEDAKAPSNVLWQAVLGSEEAAAAAFQEPKSSEPVASFPAEVTKDGHDEVTRASVYVEDNAESSGEDDVSESGLPKVDSNSQLLNMETIVLSETESSDIDEPDPRVQSKLCYGPDLSPIPGCSVLSTFVQDVENDLEVWEERDGTNFNLSNSLDIEKELSQLLGTLSVEERAPRTPSFPNETEDYDNVPGDSPEPGQQRQHDGSEVNLGYISTESGDGDSLCSSAASGWTWEGFTGRNSICDPYWVDQRNRSKSFVENGRRFGRLLRHGKQRMSMIEFRTKNRKDRRTRSVVDTNSQTDAEPSDSAVFFEPRQPRFLRLAYDRSSVMEPRVTSVVSLPSRPHSALADKLISSRCSFESDAHQSLRTRSVAIICILHTVLL